jgi:flagellar biosynthesis/type III secretory pathway M-ring protein FliF/YscJ
LKKLSSSFAAITKKIEQHDEERKTKKVKNWIMSIAGVGALLIIIIIGTIIVMKLLKKEQNKVEENAQEMTTTPIVHADIEPEQAFKCGEHKNAEVK